MNERIKDLAEQAGWGKGETHDDCMQCSPFDKEKFAELIVRECAKIADIADENKCEWIGGNVLTHFGVEE